MQRNYQDSYLEDRVYSASPVELIRMLYRAAIESVDQARQCLGSDDIAGRNRAVNRACDIVVELTQSLRAEETGTADFERRLRQLYDFVLTRIADGHTLKKDAPLAEAKGVLETLLQAWEAVPEPHPAAMATTASGEDRLSFQA